MTTKVEEQKTKRVFEVEGKEYAVRRPTMPERVKANELRRKTFNDELQAGTLLRDQLDEELRKRKMWSDDREIRYQSLRQDIIDSEFKLAKGGISLKDAKDIAVEMRSNRQQMVTMLSSRTDLDANTCEGKADSARFNFLYASCLVYNDSGDQYFEDGVDSYILKQDNDIVAIMGSTEFFYLMSETDDVDEKLPENKFLKKYKFANKDYVLIDKDGKLIDSDGRHINEDGFFVKWTSDDEYVTVDADGRELDEDGDFTVDHSPFLDEDGKAIDESEFESQEEPEPEPEQKVEVADSTGEVEEANRESTKKEVAE